jgi:hypothetical protein
MLGTLRFPKSTTKVSLRTEANGDVYPAVLKLAKERLWPSQQVVSDGGVLAPDGALVIRSDSAPSFPYAHVNGIKYGAFSWPSGRTECFGYVEGRQAARIDYVLQISAMCRDTTPLQRSVALIRRFSKPIQTPWVPWEEWYVCC